MTTREIKIVLGTSAVVIFTVLTVFIKNNTTDTYADIIQAVSSVFSLVISLIAIYYVFKTYNAQKEENVESKKELERNRQDVEYNRCVEVIYKQMEINKSTYERLVPTINYLEANYKTIDDIPNVIERLMTLSLNHFKMSVITEQFISRTTLHDHDKSYLQLVYEENYPPEFLHPLAKFSEHIKSHIISDGSIEVKRKYYEDLYVSLFYSKLKISKGRLIPNFSALTEEQQREAIWKIANIDNKKVWFANVAMSGGNLNNRYFLK